MEVTYNKYLLKLSQKCNLSDEFLDIIDNLLDKLIEFGYISKRDKLKFSKKLFNNIDTVIISQKNFLDFKTGYYDANKKEIYLKDISNLQSVYLRLLYAMVTKEVSHNVYNTGYASSFQSKNSFEIEHVNFGLNRAIISNLVCRLLYTLPTTLSIVPTYRTYENDFLGFKISSDNDIYFLEGKLVRQICFILGISEERLYSNLFSINPTREISKIFDKIQNTDLLKNLDKLSRKYSNYNKLCYYNKLISDNYIEIKKTANTPEANIALSKKREISISVKKIMQKMFPSLDSDDEDNVLSYNLEGSLSEKIGCLEDEILEIISSIQKILADELLKSKTRFSPLGYVIKLKEYEELLILKNEEIKREIHDTIMQKLIFANEYSCTNFIEKIKYSLALTGLSTHSNIKLFDDTKFYKIITNKNDISNCKIAIRNMNFLEIANISSLSLDTPSIENNVEVLKLQSIAHMLNASSSSDSIEKLVTNIRDFDESYKNLDINNIYLTKDETGTYIVINNINSPAILSVDKDMNLSKLNLSEEYNILGMTNSLPTVYKENRLFGFIRNLPIFQKAN